MLNNATALDYCINCCVDDCNATALDFYWVKIMGYIREPERVDFVVDPRPLKKWEKAQISDIIAHYKKTAKIKKITHLQKREKLHFKYFKELSTR